MMDEATLKVVVDSLFAVVEKAEAGHPLLAAATAMLRGAVDANLPAVLALVKAKLAAR